MINDPAGHDDHALPYLFPFITFRQESFGGLVFNPYLPQEIELDPVEACITKMCIANYRWSDAETMISTRYGMTPKEASFRVNTTIEKLNTAVALGKRKNSGDPFSHAPDMETFDLSSPPLSAPRSVIWEITRRCNLRCAHCLNSSGIPKANEMSYDQLNEIADQFAEEKIFTVSLSGGEPFTYPHIVDLLYVLAQKNMRVDIASNGFFISEKVFVALRDLPVFNIQVSIDGIGDSHDKLRGKQGAFDASVRTLRRIKAEGIATSISTTVTHQNINTLDAILNLALELECVGFKAIPFMPTGRGRKNRAALSLSPQEHYRMCKWIKENAEKMCDQINISTDTTFTFLLEGTTGLDPTNGRIGCSAGYDTLYVAADGTVYPCPFLKDFPIGNLSQTGLKHLWQTSPVLEKLRTLQKSDLPAPCNQCSAALQNCGGGCRASAFLASGNLSGADPNCFLVSMG